MIPFTSLTRRPDSPVPGAAPCALRTWGVYLVAGLVTVILVAGALFWLATWTLYGYMPPFKDVLGAILAETSRGLFIGAGLLGGAVVLRVLSGIGQRFVEPHSRRWSR